MFRPHPAMIGEVEPNRIRFRAYLVEPAQVCMVNPTSSGPVVITEPIETLPTGTMILGEIPGVLRTLALR
jgi:hypothetical protein